MMVSSGTLWAVLFTAHNVPLETIMEGDPYVEPLRQTIPQLVPALALEGEAPVAGHKGRHELRDRLLQLLDVGVALHDGLERHVVGREEYGPLVDIAAVERRGGAPADGPHEAAARVPALEQRDLLAAGGVERLAVLVARQARGERAEWQGDHLVAVQLREAIGHGGLGVQEAAAHADGEGELLDEARLQGERLARRDVGQGRSAADELVARLHDLEGLRVRGAPGHALQEVGDLLRAARSAEGEQGDVDGALGHGGRPFQMGVADRRCTASTRYLTLSGGVCGMRP